MKCHCMACNLSGCKICRNWPTRGSVVTHFTTPGLCADSYLAKLKGQLAMLSDLQAASIADIVGNQAHARTL